MNNEKMNQIIDEVYSNYLKNGQQEADRNRENQTFLPMPKQMFINKIKTNDEFLEKWGLKIEERELSLEERYDLIEKDKHKQFVTWQSHGTNRIKEVIDEQGLPTKLITVTYKDERIEIYEN